MWAIHGPPMQGRVLCRPTMIAIFNTLVYLHIAFGSVGLVLFWLPVITKKGGKLHRRSGFWFGYSMLITGSLAIAISFVTLTAPTETHPLVDDVELIRAQFGWLMLYLALLTVSLAWHGMQSVRYKRDHTGHRTPGSILLQISVIAAAINCSVHGWLIDKTLLIWVGGVGLLSASTILLFIFSKDPKKTEYLHFHVRSSVGGGISAYTAFLSVSLVRTMPEETFNPWLWAIPTALGSVIIGYHEAKMIMKRYRKPRAVAG
ncbi:MAG: hypothetical protein AB1Z98_11455 [Nannocystaceae bacterium]